MSYLNFVSEYDKYPKTKVEGFKAYQDYEEILPVLKKDFINKRVVVFEMYPGVNYEEVLHNLIEKLNFNHVINIDDYSKTEDEINKMIEKNLTNDRVFGIMSHFKIKEFYDESYLEKLNKLIFEDRKNETFLVYGFGASLIKSYDELVYFDMARWEIQLRYRNGMSNWKTFNPKEDNLKKFKRGYFIEWRVADRLKKEVLKKSKYYIDTVKKNNPKMIETIALFKGLNKVSRSPFRLVPYFDPGVWGGQWMKEVCNLDKSKQNYAWSFDGVPEENSIYLDFNGVMVETPSINVVFFEPINLLGNKVHGRYGTEYPIRFDFLDTMDGGNLSLQVHPLTEYIQDTFKKSSLEGKAKIYIIENIESATKEAMNTLLKMLEEPTSGIYAIFTTNNISRVLPTILSRCQVIDIKPDSKEVIYKALIKSNIPEEAAKILTYLSASEEEAKNLYDERFEYMQTEVINFIEDLYTKRMNLIINVQTNLLKNYKERDDIKLFLNMLVLAMKDMFHVKHNQNLVFSAHYDFFNSLQIDENKLIKQIEIILETIYTIESNANLLMLMDSMMYRL